MRAQNAIFIGGYSKSGTTFLGRLLGLFEGVYAKGELDYFRIFFKEFSNLGNEFNKNIRAVNREVYDGKGTIPIITHDSFKELNKKIFDHIFWGGQTAPPDCHTIVEKSPHNIFWTTQIEYIFPAAKKLAIIRDSRPVFRSFMRHMRDHRDKEYANPDFANREESMKQFLIRWNRVKREIEKHRERLITISYDRLAADTAAFVPFAQERIFERELALSSPLESISKEAYLKTLPKEARAKSLVQTGNNGIVLSAEEEAKLLEHCPLPNVSYDF